MTEWSNGRKGPYSADLVSPTLPVLRSRWKDEEIPQRVHICVEKGDEHSRCTNVSLFSWHFMRFTKAHLLKN